MALVVCPGPQSLGINNSSSLLVGASGSLRTSGLAALVITLDGQVLWQFPIDWGLACIITLEGLSPWHLEV